MAIAWFGLLVLLMILGTLVAMTGLGVYAILKNRPGIIVGMGALLLGLMGFGLLLSLWLYTGRAVAPRPATIWTPPGPIDQSRPVESSAGLAEAYDQAFEEMNAQALMERVDAPRIQLSPTSPNPAKVANKSETSEESNATVGKSETQPTAAAEDEKNSEDAEAVAMSESPESDGEDLESTDVETAPEAGHVAETSLTSASEDAKVEPAPETKTAPAPRPAWVDARPQRVGDSVREVIATDEYATVEECLDATDMYLLFKTYERVRELTGQRPDPVFDLSSIGFDNMRNTTKSLYGTQGWTRLPQLQYLQFLDIGLDYVRREIVAKDPGGEPRQYFETNARSVGPMHRLYTQIEFTPSVDRELRRRWESHERKKRLAAAGFGAGGVLGLLGLVYGLLKVDTWTKGYYTKRLFLGVPAAIIGLLALVTLFA
jgi:hypothetical protein